MERSITADEIKTVGNVLLDDTKPLKARFRALFTLRNIGGQLSVEYISKGFKDSSALLKHECAFCLGQMQTRFAIPTLISVLSDRSQEAMVRHEAGEALGAIGDVSVLPLLEEYVNDPVVEVAETCQLAVARLKWLSQGGSTDGLVSGPYMSVDPAPASQDTDVLSLRKTLLDEGASLFDRYRAMFTLRNIGSDPAVLALAAGLRCTSALFRHEIAYVLGQIQSPVSIGQLRANLEDLSENEMVRHECAEALGSIATEECQDLLDKYLSDKERVVRESCEIALDMCEYEQSGELQYADTLQT